MAEGLGEEGSAINRRRRSTGFPVVSLAEAAAILKEAGKYGFEHSTAAFATYMGHSTTNSGAFRQRLAAFRDLKLIAGRGDSLAMTEIGRMIAVPTDERSERRAMQTAFANSPEFLRLYDGSAKGQPLAAGPLGGRAVHDFGVAPGSKDKFVQSFSESAIAAGLAERNEDGQLLLLVPEDDNSSPDAPLADTSPIAPPEPEPGPSRQRSNPGDIPTVVHQTWEIDAGTITFEIAASKPLPASAFVTVGEVVASLERLAGTLAPAQSSSPAEGAED
jgi:hypothetical protein